MIGGALYFTPEKVCKIITACMTLHNMCKKHHIELESDEYVEDEDIVVVDNINNNHNNELIQTATRVRNQLVETHFI